MSSVAQRMSPPFSPTESQIEVAYSVCRGITRAAARNFYYAFLVLPKAKRQALSAIYAFMRRCDDIADDETFAVAERKHMLTAWLDGVHRAQAGHPTDDPGFAGADRGPAAILHSRHFARPVGLRHGDGFGR